MKTRKPVRSDSLNSKLAAYSATAVAALAVAPAADAAIQDITTFSINSGPFSATAPDLSGNGGLNFIGATTGHKSAFVGGLHATRAFNPTSSSGDGRVGLANQGKQIAIHATSGNVSKIPLGGTIMHRNFADVATHQFQTVASRRFSLLNASGRGDFLPGGPNAAKTGYVAFKTQLHGHTYYGWLHIKVTADGGGDPTEISLTPALDDPNIFGAFGLGPDDITAGEFAAPEPSTFAIGGLGLLALGARGVREMRRRRKQEAADRP